MKTISALFILTVAAAIGTPAHGTPVVETTKGARFATQGEALHASSEAPRWSKSNCPHMKSWTVMKTYRVDAKGRNKIVLPSRESQCSVAVERKGTSKEIQSVTVCPGGQTCGSMRG